jgi:hypothetical protein
MTLSDLIARLEKEDPSRVLPLGFANPHSYRGDYSCLAFAPMRPCSVASMLNAARSALGNTYQGWKGGDYAMTEWTDVYLAERGDCGETLGPTLLDFMLAAPSPRDEGRGLDALAAALPVNEEADRRVDALFARQPLGPARTSVAARDEGRAREEARRHARATVKGCTHLPADVTAPVACEDCIAEALRIVRALSPSLGTAPNSSNEEK